MEHQNLGKLTQITDPSQVKVGDRVVQYTYGETGLYWVTVHKATPKTIVVECPHASYDAKHQEYRMQESYRGSGRFNLTAWGKANGTLYRANSAEAVAIVDASAQARLDAATAKQATRDEQKRQTEEREAKEKVEALAANFGVEFQEIGMLGKQRYFSANVLNHNGNVCFVVAGVTYGHDIHNYDRDPVTRERIYKMVYIASLNYAEDRGGETSIGTMASCSPDITADTPAELWQNIIARVW